MYELIETLLKSEHFLIAIVILIFTFSVVATMLLAKKFPKYYKLWEEK